MQKQSLSFVVRFKGYIYVEILVYLRAFDFFVNTKKIWWSNYCKRLEYSGLDMDAMLHDYHYVQYNVKASFFE
jgi:hypothetical protein